MSKDRLLCGARYGSFLKTELPATIVGFEKKKEGNFKIYDWNWQVALGMLLSPEFQSGSLAERNVSSKFVAQV